MRESQAGRGSLSRQASLVWLAVAAIGSAAVAQAELTMLDDSGSPDFEVAFTAPDPAQLAGRVAAHVTPEGDRLEVVFDRVRATLALTKGGAAKELASGAIPAANGPTEVIVQRRGGLFRLVVGGASVCQAYTRAITTGAPGYSLEGLAGAEVTVQPLGEIEYGETFSWESKSEAARAWEKVLGDWTNAKSGDWTNPDAIRRQQARMSANLFAFEGKGEPQALAVTGYPHWSAYQVASAVKSLAGGAIGLVVYYNGPGDYLLFRATCQTAPEDDRGKFQLVLVRNGQSTVLAEADGGIVRDEWYQLRVRALDDQVLADVDTVNVLRLDGFGQLVRGRIGLYCEGKGGAKFDDVSLASTHELADDFADGLIEWWEGVGPEWSVGPAGDARGHVLSRKTGEGAIMAGGDAWRNYLLAADIDVKAGGALLFNAADADTSDAFVWEPGGACKLVARRGGQEQVLGEGRLEADVAGWAPVRVQLRDEYLRVLSGDQTIVEGVDPQANGGAFGLRGREGSRFDKVVVRPFAVGVHEAVTEQFAHEDTMREWARVAGQWVAPSDEATDFGIHWNKGDFYGDCELSADIARLAEAPRFASFVLGSDGSGPDAGYTTNLTQGDGDSVDITLSRLGQVVGQADNAPVTLPTQLRVSRFGSLVVVSLGDTPIIQYRDPEVLTGTRIGVKPGGLPISLNTVSALAHNERDYAFSSAPTEWFVRGGTWEVTSRWTCQPEWSWFSTASDGPAPIWSKRAFGSDITVELYASLKMVSGADAPGHGYNHPHDLNVTLCGDGKSVSSGYSFVIGGYLGSKTQILKGTQVLAETGEANAMLPSLCDGLPNDMNDFHRHWWQIRPQKQGNRLRLYFENKLVLEAEDPEPLQDGHVALWTWNNAIMVARAHIYGVETGDVMLPQVSETARRGAADQRAPESTLTLVSSTHPGLVCDFESGPGEFTGLSGNLGASICLDKGASPTGDTCLRVENEEAGGDFAVRAIDTDFRIGEMPVLSFDYRITPESKVDVLLKGARGDYLVRFTGPVHEKPGQILLGSIPDVEADGKWRHASFDLSAAFIAREHDLSNDRITEVRIGDFSDDRDLSIGFTGNPAGAVYWLDNFAVRAGGGPAAKFALSDRSKTATAIGYTVDQDPTTVPPAEAKIQGPTGEVDVDALGPGTWYVHAAIEAPDGTWSAPVHYAFAVDGEAPALSRSGDRNIKGAPRCVALPVSDAGSGIAVDSLRVSAGGQEMAVDGAVARYDPSQAAVLVDLALLTPPVADGQTLDFAVTHAQDRVGNVAEKGRPVTLTVDYRTDTDPPPPPRITSGGEGLCSDTFETDSPLDMGEWEAIPGTGSAVVADDTTAASGLRSLKVYCDSAAGQYQVYARKTAFDAGKYRVISFDYRIDPWIRVDMVIQTSDGAYRAIRLTDRDTEYPILSQVEGLQADGQWRHAEIDLYGILRSRMPSLTNLKIRSVRIGGSGWPGNGEGASYHIDNFRIMAVASARDALRFTWDAADVTGISGASYVLDVSGGTEPDDTIEVAGSQASFTEVPEGPACFHVKLRDGAGNWGPTTHHWCQIDNRGLTASAVSPAAGSTLCTSEVSMTLADEGTAGVDPSSIVLSVAGVDYTVDNEGLTFDSGSGQLRWNASDVAPQPVAIADKTEVPVSLKKATDFAGNGLNEPVGFTWTMDYSTDVDPPGAPEITSTSHVSAFYNPFEGTAETGALGEWKGSAGSKVELDNTTAASGQGSLKFTFAEGRICRAEVRRTPFDVAKCPLVSFDYKAPAGTQVDLLFVVNGAQVLVSFTDQERSARSRVPGVIADGEWHHVRDFDLNTAAQLVIGRQREMQCTLVALLDAGRLETPQGANLWIDNFAIYRPGKGQPRLRWKAGDPTGIAGFSYVVDDNPGTIPDEQFEGADTSVVLDELPAGVHYFHIRARDGAGHWSPTTHYTLVQR